MNNDKYEYLKTCFFADKLFNEYFDEYIFRKNVLEIMNLDINTQKGITKITHQKDQDYTPTTQHMTASNPTSSPQTPL